jgi:hypothetical protein
MLAHHLNAIEDVLLAQGKVAAKAGHPNLIGGPKEWFIRDFLNDHLPATVKIGQGEIIDSHSKVNSSSSTQNQIDIVLYNHNFPKIAYSKFDSAFLKESVVTTIEIKSKIDKGKLRESCKASINLKNRKYDQEPDPNRKYEPVGQMINMNLPIVTSYVVAYDAVSQFSTVANWLPKLNSELKVMPEDLIDMMIVLGKGTVWRLKSFPQLGQRLQQQHPSAAWAYIEQEDKNLLLLFLHMLSHMASTSHIPFDSLAYAKNIPFRNIVLL